MGQRISGSSFDTDFGGVMVHVETVTLAISDETAAANTRGVPDGFTNGAVGADGEIEVDTQNFLKFQAIAQAAGSWRAIPTKDFLFYAKAGTEELKVEAFGCKLMLSDLLNIDATNSDKKKHKIKYIVTDPNFVHINGIPVLSEADVRDLIG